MKFRSFYYPVPNDGLHEDLNGFLSRHRVLKVREELLQDGRIQVFVVEYLDSASFDGIQTKKAPRVDYREILSAEEFGMFSQLRELRKEIAEAEGVPVYNVFTNAQLAAIVTSQVKTKTCLGKIEGVGASRLERFGDLFLEKCRELFVESET